MKNTKNIPIIDLFAGPGGLAEGFSSLVNSKNERFFNVKLSIEKDADAHKTLKLRSFLRQFPLNELPNEYYDFLKQNITMEKLFSSYPEENKEAEKEAWQATLGITSNAEIDERIIEGLAGEKDWVLIGGPPCQAYSLVGRSRVGGINKEDHRVLLYKEYLRIIAVHQPAVFVMENVKGLLSAKVEGEKVFDNIMADLQDPSSVFEEHPGSKYKIYSLVKSNVKTDSDYLIKSELYGIPQKRHRVILLGIRDDILVEPGTLALQKEVILKSVINDLPKVRSGLYREFIGSEDIIADGVVKKKRYYRTVKDNYVEWSRLVTRYANDLNELLPDDFRTEGDLPKTIGAEYLPAQESIPTDHPLYTWYNDEKMDGVVNHVSRGHLTQDLKRYLFSSLYTRKFNKFPRMDDFRAFGADLVPDHESAESGKFSDRFRVQVSNTAATTVTSHISKDGHYFIHYDPLQCRSLTVREAARIQTFPDNYFFCGSRTQQFHQVGNAVPPYLAYQISKVVHAIIEKVAAKRNETQYIEEMSN